VAIETFKTQEETLKSKPSSAAGTAKKFGPSSVSRTFFRNPEQNPSYYCKNDSGQPYNMSGNRNLQNSRRNPKPSSVLRNCKEVLDRVLIVKHSSGMQTMSA